MTIPKARPARQTSSPPISRVRPFTPPIKLADPKSGSFRLASPAYAAPGNISRSPANARPRQADSRRKLGNFMEGRLRQREPENPLIVKRGTILVATPVNIQVDKKIHKLFIHNDLQTIQNARRIKNLRAVDS